MKSIPSSSWTPLMGNTPSQLLRSLREELVPNQMYGLVLASAGDAVVPLLQHGWNELETVVQGKWEWVVFRDRNRRISLEPFAYMTEQAPLVYTIARTFDLLPNTLPCLLFFEQPLRNYLLLPLRAQTAKEVLQMVRHLTDMVLQTKNAYFLLKQQRLGKERTLENG